MSFVVVCRCLLLLSVFDVDVVCCLLVGCCGVACLFVLLDVGCCLLSVGCCWWSCVVAACCYLLWVACLFGCSSFVILSGCC